MLEKKLNEVTVSEIMSEPTVFVDKDEKLSSGIAKMRKFDTCVLPISENGDYKGLITAQQILNRDIPPDISDAEASIIYPPLISSDTSLAEACEKMWLNDLLGIPVGTKGNLEGIVSFWDIIDWAKGEKEFRKRKIKEIDVSDTPVIDIHEEVSKAKATFRDKRLTKLLVKDESIEDMARAEDMFTKVLNVPLESMTLGDRKGEKYKRLGIESRTITRTIPFTLKKDDSIYKMIDEMKKHFEVYAVVNKSVVTFKNFLKYLADFRIGVDYSDKVRFVVDTKFSDFIWMHWRGDLESFLEKYHKRLGKDSLRTFRITIRELHKTGTRGEYEMSGKIVCDLGDFYAEKNGWKPIVVFHDMLDALRRQVWKKAEKEKIRKTRKIHKH